MTLLTSLCALNGCSSSTASGRQDESPAPSGSQASGPQASGSPAAAAATLRTPDIPPTATWSVSLTAGENSAEAVRTLYAVHISAARNCDPRTFRETISGGSLRTFETLRRNALGASRAQVEKLPPTQQINVITLRMELSRQELGTGDLAFIMLPLLDSQVYHDLSARTYDLQGLTVSGDTASAKIFTDGEDSLNRAFFRREKGVWKVDLPAFEQSLNAQYEEMLPPDGEVAGLDVGPISPRMFAASALLARYKGEDIAKAYEGID